LDNEQNIPCLLTLADGTVWPGRAFGAIGERTGEICFNTSLTGYQEILTDPSYHGQIVVMSQPHIGNTGVNNEDDESQRAWLSGFVVREASPVTGNWRATKSLDQYLRERGVAAISKVDVDSLPQGVKVTHINLNDHCVEGLRAASLRAFSIQYHPEAAPGPHDARYLFDDFVSLMKG
jgi:carbamoylphosphate synthase small subunit